jgi:hypothetical protein
LKKASNLDDLIFAQITGAARAKRKYFAVQGDGPIAIVCFVHITETLKQHAHVVPLDVVIKRVSEDLLDGNSVVVIQLD